MIKLIKKLIKKKIFKKIDYYFAKNIAKKYELLLLITATYISFLNRQGYTFLSLKKIKKNKIFSKEIIHKIKNIKNIKKELLKSDAVGNKDKNFPLILDGKNLYLNKIWIIERKILKFLTYKYTLKEYNLHQWKIILKNKFFKKSHIEQKIAILLCLLNKFTIILGSPGTGKTQLISKIIYFFIQISKKKKILLTSPTGKASSILIESVKKNKYLLNIKNKYKKYIPNSAFTIHDLFKINNYYTNNFFNRAKKIHYDLLIIDESSMIDIFMLEKIIDSSNQNGQIIFLGDHNQLPSINNGSFLQDIFSIYKETKNQEIYVKLINFIKKKFSKLNKKNITKKVFILKKRYRFKKKSNINQCSKIIKKFKQKQIKNIFNNKFNNIKFSVINKSYFSYKNMIKKIFKMYKNYWKMIFNKYSYKKILKYFNKIRILCILKKGMFGVQGINKIFKKMIFKKYFIKSEKKNKWYIGKPIMILKNNKNIKLFNGSIGITLLDKKKKMKIFFLMNNGEIKNIPINLLPKYKTTWAITIHKSQGSEFNKINIIFPLKINKIMSREIIYTAITRSKKKIHIFSKKSVFFKTASNKIIRKSGFIKNLKI
ncbi:exodeoxyribonuclease V subunit alpha [Buchnera aphidicola]|uniref:exodeoxyribonuclease V subunit alpha n=1 Tax=Buchnera aphidicola TaxID=9 RepID=UPI002237A88B|nr:exodeoxyribonuclease V subunit alpha [Buchnera aphidicola]MCW5197535.1 exodeoxyribonuclease V subunit alpha [Buchnera aphidicola (Chaitophorus viminalis)]